jgi:drug/metabolite transporter, DME family
MRQIGILQALISGLCFGFLGIFGKKAYEAGLAPGEFLSLRFLLASSLLGSWLFFTQRKSLQLPLKIILRCLALGAFGYAVFSSCYFYALEGLSASLTVLLLYTYPIYVTLGSVIFFREKIKVVQWIALPIMGIGMACLVWGEMAVRSSSALIFGFCSGIFYSIYILCSSRITKGYPPFACGMFIMLGAALTLACIHLRLDTFSLPFSAWMNVLGASVISTIFAMALFLSALQKLTSTETSLLSTAEPLSGVILATLFLGDLFSHLQWFGGFLLLFGMILIALRKT